MLQGPAPTPSDQDPTGLDDRHPPAFQPSDTKIQTHFRKHVKSQQHRTDAFESYHELTRISRKEGAFEKFAQFVAKIPGKAVKMIFARLQLLIMNEAI